MTHSQDAETLRVSAGGHRERGNLAGAAMLELAAALCLAAGPVPPGSWFSGPSKPNDQPQPTDPGQAFAEWAEGCAAVLAAMSRSLAGAEVSWKGGSVTNRAESLPAVAERLAATTRGVNEALLRTASSLRSETVELVRRASEVGSLERAVHRERGRLREAVEHGKALEEELAGLTAERARAAAQVARLQERLRLAGWDTEQRRAIEREVEQAEQAAAQDRAAKEALERRLQSLEEERNGLGERIARTRAMIQELEKSPDRELIQRVHEIWSCLPPDSTGLGGHG